MHTCAPETPLTHGAPRRLLPQRLGTLRVFQQIPASLFCRRIRIQGDPGWERAIDDLTVLRLNIARYSRLPEIERDPVTRHTIERSEKRRRRRCSCSVRQQKVIIEARRRWADRHRAPNGAPSGITTFTSRPRRQAVSSPHRCATYPCAVERDGNDQGMTQVDSRRA
jgi:hypothetical protein